MITIELLTEKNFTLNSLDSYDRRHDVKRVYRKKDNGYILVDLPYVEDWSLDDKRRIAADICSGEYISYLALDEGVIAGFIGLKKKLNGDYMILDMMHVGAKYRGTGIGRQLFNLGKAEALKAGAKALYISACSSEETIAFYRAMGAEITDNPIPEMAEDEPYDLQMTCPIKEQ